MDLTSSLLMSLMLLITFKKSSEPLVVEVIDVSSVAFITLTAKFIFCTSSAYVDSEHFT